MWEQNQAKEKRLKALAGSRRAAARIMQWN